MGRGARPVNYRPVLTPAEVARMLRVSPRTLSHWARTGKIACVRTIGGHRRYYEDDIRKMLGDNSKSQEITGSNRERVGL